MREAGHEPVPTRPRESRNGPKSVKALESECEQRSRNRERNVAKVMVKRESSVERDLDYHAWLESQTAALRARQRAGLDWDKLAEELDAMAASQRSELKNRLHVLLLHLLKWQTQPNEREFRGRGWLLSMREARRQIKDLIDYSPSLKHYLPDLLAGAWEWACEDALDDAPDCKFSAVCPWAYEEFMARDFLPADVT
ncbi:MAG: DUF29 domain-containing protein [Candidatus Binataceae bacterium]